MSSEGGKELTMQDLHDNLVKIEARAKEFAENQIPTEARAVPHDKTKCMKVHIGGVDNCYGPVVGPEGKHHNGYAFTFEQLKEHDTANVREVLGEVLGECENHATFIDTEGYEYRSVWIKTLKQIIAKQIEKN